jgi:hypothetical protein
MVAIIALAFRETLDAIIDNKSYNAKKAAPNGTAFFKITDFFY